ncbi:MAG: hypothetical protein HYT94_05320 [Parcubacteria group bacterium]|nr:hypothetical protein [Parcubacteria group bacterium]
MDSIVAQVQKNFESVPDLFTGTGKKVTENGFTVVQEEQILKETEWTLKHGKGYKNVAEMFKDILGDEFITSSEPTNR